MARRVQFLIIVMTTQIVKGNTEKYLEKNIKSLIFAALINFKSAVVVLNKKILVL